MENKVESICADMPLATLLKKVWAASWLHRDCTWLKMGLSFSISLITYQCPRCFLFCFSLFIIGKRKYTKLWERQDRTVRVFFQLQVIGK